MGLFDKLKGELIDIVEWLEDDAETLAYRFERYGNEIKNGAKLTVREGQIAVFVNEGEPADIFEPGMYTLETANLPILSTLKGWKYGFESPFKAEVIFISTRKLTGFGWGTPSPFYLPDPRTGADVEVTARGTFNIHVEDPAQFVRQVVGSEAEFTKEEIQGQLRERILVHLIDAIGESGLSVFQLASRYRDLGELVSEHAQNEFMEDYGIKVDRVSIANVGLPDEYREMVRELNRMRMMAGQTDTYQKIKQADAMVNLAGNQGAAGGMAAGGMGMGMGLAMANQMGGMMGTNPAMARPAAAPPPPPPAAAFHVAVNGRQMGPFPVAALQQQVQQGRVTADTLVWKPGMAGWAAASTVPELASLFRQQAPPPPPPAG